MKRRIISLVLCLLLVFSVATSVTVFADATTQAGIVGEAESSSSGNLTAATMPEDTNLSIFLKNEKETSELRQTLYRWNVNDTGTTFNLVIHLDDANGNNCEMRLESCVTNGIQYYAIRYAESSYYIDTEGNNSKAGEVLHQYHTSVKQDNQKFRFVPVPGEKDTYYIMTRNGDKDNINLYVGTLDGKVGEHVKIATTTTPTKWVISEGDKAYSTGKEKKLTDYEHTDFPAERDFTVFTLSPVDSIYDVNVENDYWPYNGNDLHLYYTGTSSKMRAEYVASQDAYRLRSLNLDENDIDDQYNINQKDYVWDIEDESLSPGAVAHIWTNKGNEHKSQLWRFIPVEGKRDVYYIYNCNSKLYLSLEDTKNYYNENLVVQSKDHFAWKMTILNATDYETEAKIWMSAISDDTPLSEINIPGADEAGAANIFGSFEEQTSFGRAQQLYLNEQLNVGVRAWDIRLDATNSTDNPDIIHGFSFEQCQNAYDERLKFDEVMETARIFLEKYPSETIIMTIKEDGHTFAKENIAVRTLEKYLSDESNPYHIWKGTDGADPDYIPTLGEVRGKIVFVRRFGISDDSTDINKSYFGLDASSWDTHDYSDSEKPYNMIYEGSSIDEATSYQMNTQIWVQDHYSVFNTAEKLGNFYTTIDFATDNDITHNVTVTDEGKTIENRAYLFNYSAAKDHLYQPREINYDLLTNDYLDQPEKESEKKSIGIVMTNYLDANLAKRIYKTNFVKGSSESHELIAQNLRIVFGDDTPQIDKFYEGLEKAEAIVTKIEFWDEEGNLVDNEKLLTAGVYYVVLKLEFSSGPMIAEGATLTVERRTAEIEWSNEREFTYDGTAKCVTAEVKNLVTDESDGTHYPCDVIVSGGSATHVGSYTATALELTSSNYKLPDNHQSVTYTIKEASSSQGGDSAGVNGGSGEAVNTGVNITWVAPALVFSTAIIFVVGILLIKKETASEKR